MLARIEKLPVDMRGRFARRLLAVALSLLAGCDAPVDSTGTQLPYAREYPEIGYATTIPGGRVGSLAESIRRGTARLTHEDERGYLDSLLQALDISPSSQVLVFSRTSLQVGIIHPGTPRAIYFNDDTYVAWLPEGAALEIASYDPRLGPIFHSLPQAAAASPTPERELGRCLRCHDSYSMTGGGVPRFLLGSGYTGTDGELVSHEAWILTGQATPLRSRWGGWYVTGRHGDQVHLGNIVVRRVEDLQDLAALRIGNIDDLGGLFDASRYLTPLSDIVALMVLEHQVEVQNLLSRLRFESAGRSPVEPAGDLNEHVEALVRAMLMVDAIALASPIAGNSGFAEEFERRGPFDSNGRSLRQLELESRLFRFPMSYLIYSEGFASLPDLARTMFFDRVDAILGADPADDGFTRLTLADRNAIAAILAETLPEFAAR